MGGVLGTIMTRFMKIALAVALALVVAYPAAAAPKKAKKSDEKPAPSGKKSKKQEEPPAGPGKGIKKIGPGQYEIPRAEVYRLLARIPWFSTQLRVYKAFRNGKFQGYLLKYIKKGSVVRWAGFRDGDLVERINGLPLTATNRILLTIPMSNRIVVKLVRGGKPRKLIFRITP